MLVRPEVVNPETARAALLDLNADAYAFTPARHAPPDASPQLRRAIARSQEYARKALADGTLDTYASHWRSYLLWCSLNGGDPVGPDAADLVAAHLTDLADGLVDEAGALVLDADGRPLRAPLRSATIDGRLAAINKAFSLLGLPAPGSDPFVTRVVAGIRRTLGRRPLNRRDALTLPLLRQVLAVSHLPAADKARDLVAVALLAEPAVSSCGQVVRVEWSDVTLTDGLARISVPWPTRSHYPRREITWTPDNVVDASVFESLKVLQQTSGGVGAVITRTPATGSPAMSDEGLLRAVRRALQLSGVALPGRGLPQLNKETAASVARRISRPCLIDTHDRALLLNGFASAARRSNLADFRWCDYTMEDEGLVVFLSQSKTDQNKEGFEALLPYGQHPETCPVAHWMAWRDEVARLIGGDPCTVAPQDHVFVTFDRAGAVVRDQDGRLVGISDERINRMVARRCAEAQLQGDFGAHSLRAGFVTTAYEAGASLVDIADQTGHKSLESVRVYIRRRDRWKRNPFGRLAIAEAV